MKDLFLSRILLQISYVQVEKGMKDKSSKFISSTKFDFQNSVEQCQQNVLSVGLNGERAQVGQQKCRVDDFKKRSRRFQEKLLHDTQSQQQLMQKDQEKKRRDKCQSCKLRPVTQARRQVGSCQSPQKFSQIPKKTNPMHRLQHSLFQTHQSHRLITIACILKITEKRRPSESTLSPLLSPQNQIKREKQSQKQIAAKQREEGSDRVWVIKNLNDFMKNIKFSDDEPGDEPLSPLSADSDDSF